MAVSGITRPLLRFWFIVASILMTWDLLYMFLRPRSMPGGDLDFIWKPYALYGTIDKVYSREAWEKQLGWPLAQSFGNVIEVLMMVYHLSLKETTGRSDFLAFLVSTMTWYKTFLYFLIDYFSGWQESGHNGTFDFWVTYFAVNNVWDFVPFTFMIILGRSLLGRLSDKQKAR